MVDNTSPHTPSTHPILTGAGNIILVGMMGSGKTTLGRLLATRTGRRFIDSDHKLEKRIGASIPHIFAKEGESGFRKHESAILQDICQHQRQVIATGGGAVLADENRRLLQACGWVVYLDIPPEILWLRLREATGNRPLLEPQTPTAERRQRIYDLHAQRYPLYRDSADVIFSPDPSNIKTPSVMSFQIFSLLEKHSQTMAENKA